jgi:hypothetical protein
MLHAYFLSCKPHSHDACPCCCPAALSHAPLPCCISPSPAAPLPPCPPTPPPPCLNASLPHWPAAPWLAWPPAQQLRRAGVEHIRCVVAGAAPLQVRVCCDPLLHLAPKPSAEPNPIRISTLKIQSQRYPQSRRRSATRDQIARAAQPAWSCRSCRARPPSCFQRFWGGRWTCCTPGRPARHARAAAAPARVARRLAPAPTAAMASGSMQMLAWQGVASAMGLLAALALAMCPASITPKPPAVRLPRRLGGLNGTFFQKVVVKFQKVVVHMRLISLVSG